MIEILQKLKTEICTHYSDTGPEKVGFVLPDKVVKVMNIADKPDEGFDVDPSDIIKYTEQKGAIATWHTHPGSPSNLSGEDFHTFKMWPDLYHLIIGKDGVRCFKYDTEKKALMEHNIG